MGEYTMIWRLTGTSLVALRKGVMIWSRLVLLAIFFCCSRYERVILYRDGRDNALFAIAWSPLVDIRSRSKSRFNYCSVLRTKASNEDEQSREDPIPCPIGLSYLPFQRDVILDHIIPSSSGLDGRKGLLLADEMGLGKTVSVIGGINVLLRDHYAASSAAEQRRFKVLIVAPKSVLSHWEHELHRWIVLPPNAASDNLQVGTITAKDGIPEEECDIYLINYEIVGKYLEDLLVLFRNGNDGEDTEKKLLDVLVCDECHYLKSVDSQRTHATLGHHKHSASQPGVAALAEKLWLVTGSPILNNPLELFPLLNALGKTTNTTNNIIGEAFPEIASLSAFRDKYCGKQVTPWGITYKGGKNLSELRSRLIEPLFYQNKTAATPLMVRRTKQEVLPELPDKRHQLFPLDDGGIAASQEFELLEAVLKNGESNNHNDAAGLEMYLNSLKVVELKELAKERGLPVAGRKSELIERLVSIGTRGISHNNKDDEEDSIQPIGEDELQYSEESILFPSRASQDADSAIDLQSSALSVLQSAPNENRKQVLQKLLYMTRSNDLEVNSNALLGALGKARHQTALRKVPYVIEMLEIALVSHKVVVFAHHRDVQDIIFRHFQDQAVALNGETPPEDRMKNVQTFQNDPNIKLFVGSIRASGLGITLTAASHVVFVEMDWSPSIIQQAEDRCHRVGQHASVLVQYVYFKGTIDEHLSQLLVEKQRTLNAAIEKIPEGSPLAWVFDFGKHEGKMISDVAAENPDYLKWLVEEKIYLARKDRSNSGSELTEALLELGFLNPNAKEEPSDAKMEKDSMYSPKLFSPSEQKEAAEHVIKFGKHSGKQLKDIPPQYLEWVLREGVSKGKPGLTKALKIFLAESPSRDSRKKLWS